MGGARWVVVFLLLLLSACVRPNISKTDVTVHFISVGLGDSIFIDTPGRDVLVDGGDCGAGDTVVSYLTSINVTRIDLVVASHHDSDHVCGLIPVLQSFNVSQVWDKGSGSRANETKTFLRYLDEASKKDFTVVGRGDGLELAPGVELEVASPLQPLREYSENSDSIVLKLVAGDRKFLLTGDCETACENGMMLGLEDVGADVLKVGHHGSKYATGSMFLRLVHPEIAVIEVGQNSYGFPDPETLKRLSDQGVQVYRTDVDGSVVLHTDGMDIQREG